MRIAIFLVLLLLAGCYQQQYIRIPATPDANCVTGANMLVEIRCIQDFQDTDTVRAVQVCYEQNHTTVKAIDGIAAPWPRSIYRITILEGAE